MEEIRCEECEYFDSDNDNCSYLACDGLDCEEAPCGFPYLGDYYEWEYEDDGTVIVNGKAYTYEMTMNSRIADDKCCRVFVDGNYYYFG